jgi:hypothetical protein
MKGEEHRQTTLWDAQERTPPPAKSLAKIARKLSAHTLAFETKLHSYAAEVRDVVHIDVPREGIEPAAAAKVVEELDGLRSRFSSLLEELAAEIRRVAGEVRR